MRHWIRNDKGNVLIMVAMATAVLAGFGILTIDIGRILVTKTQLQNADDAGALAGAGMYCNGTPDEPTARAEAIKVADMNKALASKNAVDVHVLDEDVLIEEFGSSHDVTVTARSDTRQFLVFRDSITQRGLEIAIHDLNHDGYLFRDRKEFLARAEKINAYGGQFGANGFRSAALYRNQRWFDALKFSYDMSVPNVGHLEAQRGGCCTVMPYFVGDILELPVTMVQDYALFNYLNVYSIDVWKQQIELITAQHGLMNFIIHPDYITKPREWEACHSLLTHLDALRQDTGLWITTRGKVDRWWRQGAKLKLVEAEAGVRIEGEGSERARVAFSRQDVDAVPLADIGVYAEC